MDSSIPMPKILTKLKRGYHQRRCQMQVRWVKINDFRQTTRTRKKSTVVSVVNLARSQVYHTERPSLFAARLLWCTASCGFVIDSWCLISVTVCICKQDFPQLDDRFGIKLLIRFWGVPPKWGSFRFSSTSRADKTADILAHILDTYYRHAVYYHRQKWNGRPISSLV